MKELFVLFILILVSVNVNLAQNKLLSFDEDKKDVASFKKIKGQNLDEYLDNDKFNLFKEKLTKDPLLSNSVATFLYKAPFQASQKVEAPILIDAIDKYFNNNLSIEFIDILLTSGADAFALGFRITPLYLINSYAITNEDKALSLYELFLKNKVNFEQITKNKISIFSDYISKASNNKLSEKLVSFFLKAGCYVNTPDEYGTPLLTIAIINNDLKIVKLLLEYNVDVNVRASNNLLPVVAAINTQNETIYNLLVSKLVNINKAIIDEAIFAKDNKNCTAPLCLSLSNVYLKEVATIEDLKKFTVLFSEYSNLIYAKACSLVNNYADLKYFVQNCKNFRCASKDYIIVKELDKLYIDELIWVANAFKEVEVGKKAAIRFVGLSNSVDEFVKNINSGLITGTPRITYPNYNNEESVYKTADEIKQLTKYFAQETLTRYADQIIGKYLQSKIIFTETPVFWVADGDRGWLDDFVEKNRQYFSGGNKFNIFSVGTVKNTTNKNLKLKLNIEFNLLVTTNISILISTSAKKIIEPYYVEIRAGETIPFISLFRNVSDGYNIGNGLLMSMGSNVSINTKEPVTLSVENVSTDFPSDKIQWQKKLIDLFLSGQTNIATSKSSMDNMQEFSKKFAERITGIKSSSSTGMYVHFNNPNNTCTINLYDANNNAIDSKSFFNKGECTYYYSAKSNSQYKIYLSHCNKPITILPKGKLVSVIIKSDCIYRVDLEDK